MWSKRIGVLSVLAVLVFSAAAFAAVQDFKDFTVDVPDDWTATQNGTTVGIVANDNSAAVSVTVDKRDGMEAKDLAAAFAEKLKGSEPVFEDNVYHFDFKNDSFTTPREPVVSITMSSIFPSGLPLIRTDDAASDGAPWIKTIPAIPAHRTQPRARGKNLPRTVSFEPPAPRVFHKPNNLRTFPHLNFIKDNDGYGANRTPYPSNSQIQTQRR